MGQLGTGCCAFLTTHLMRLWQPLLLPEWVDFKLWEWEGEKGKEKERECVSNE